MSIPVPGERLIMGTKVPTPTKKQLASEIARHLNIAPPTMSKGSTVLSELLTRIYEAVTNEGATDLGAYAKTAGILDHLDLTYDPHWDTSEAQEKGGSTVTTRAYSRMLCALSRTPRCFVLNRTDAKVGTAWEVDDDRHYRYDRTVTGRGPLNDAGPGSQVIYYNTSSDSRSPMTYTAYAQLQYIRPGWEGPWDAELREYHEFETPISANRVTIRGRNNQHAITEIAFGLFQDLVEAGQKIRPTSTDVGAGLDIGGAQAAARIDLNFPVADVVVEGDDVPHRRLAGVLTPGPERTPVYVEDASGGLPGDGASNRRSEDDRRRDKLVEARAVAAALKHFKRMGWALGEDRQLEGVGYDLELTDGSRRLHLEVKGIRGSRLAFNLTAKEWWRARTDPDFIVAAVTGALSPRSARVNLITPEELVHADRVATQYRIGMPAQQQRKSKLRMTPTREEN